MTHETRSIRRDYTKEELELLFYEVMAVGKTIASDFHGNSLSATLPFGIAFVSAAIATKLNDMKDSDTLHVDVEDIPSWVK